MLHQIYGDMEEGEMEREEESGLLKIPYNTTDARSMRERDEARH
jgi:hypothetical protein